MQQQALDLFGAAPRVVTGRQLKRRGQQAALRRAGVTWQVKVMKALRGWLVMKDEETGCMRQHFVFEDFREYATRFQALKPLSSNAWGALPKLALAAGLIESTNQMARAKRPTARGRLVHVWAIK